jgi:hypothetical protein
MGRTRPPSPHRSIPPGVAAHTQAHRVWPNPNPSAIIRRATTTIGARRPPFASHNRPCCSLPQRACTRGCDALSSWPLSHTNRRVSTRTRDSAKTPIVPSPQTHGSDGRRAETRVCAPEGGLCRSPERLGGCARPRHCGDAQSKYAQRSERASCSQSDCGSDPSSHSTKPVILVSDYVFPIYNGAHHNGAFIPCMSRPRSPTCATATAPFFAKAHTAPKTYSTVSTLSNTDFMRFGQQSTTEQAFMHPRCVNGARDREPDPWVKGRGAARPQKATDRGFAC